MSEADREIRIATIRVACDMFERARAELERALDQYDDIVEAPHRFHADELLAAQWDVRAAAASFDGWYGVVMFGAEELARGFVDAGAGV